MRIIRTINTAFAWLQRELKDGKHEITKLEPPVKAEGQVVAGYKYRLICPYKSRSGEGSIEAVVYKKLDGTYILKNIVFKDAVEPN